MVCSNCGKDTPLSSVLFCPYCGTKYTEEKAEKKSRIHGRANGTGTAFRRGKTWTARVVLGWKPSPDGSHKIPIWDTKGGFPTKKDALNYCTTLLEKAAPKKRERITLKTLFDKWEPWYSPRVGASTMAGYRAAFAYFSSLNNRFIDTLSPGDLQTCMDNCDKGKRTHQMMRVTAGLLWQYALDNDIIDKNITSSLYTGKGQSVQREPLTEKEVETIHSAIGRIRYADYVYALCYLGFRPGEFLALKKDAYQVIDGIEVLVGGSKTEAGRNRLVPVPPQIADIVRSRLYVPGTDLLFPMYVFSRKDDSFVKFKDLTHDHFNKHIFKRMMQTLGIADGKVPYSARHTYADKLKNSEGSRKAKSGIMGHTDYALTENKYQSVDINDLLEVAATIE